jgi:hypothetical protein
LSSRSAGVAQRIERQHFGGNKTTVEAISDGAGRDRGDDQPEGVDLLAAMQRNGGQRQRSEHANGNPEKNAQDFWHEGYLIWRRVSGEYCGRTSASFASAPIKSDSLCVPLCSSVLPVVRALEVAI